MTTLAEPDVVDAFVNVFREGENPFAKEGLLRHTSEFFGADTRADFSLDAMIEAMDQAGVRRAIATEGLFGGGLEREANESAPEELLARIAPFPDRLRASFLIDALPSIRAVNERIEHFARHPLVVAIRIVPHVVGEPINSRTFYPIYERCEALGLVVTINVGIPGPKVRAAHQHPLLLDDVLLDFPGLVIVATHMGHPYETTLIGFMMKYENLYLSNSAYLARYIDPRVVKFMQSSRGIRKLIFASDYPILTFERSLAEARKLPLSPAAMHAFLGGNARRVFRW